MYMCAQYLDVLSSEIIEKNLYKICILYIKDVSLDKTSRYCGPIPNLLIHSFIVVTHLLFFSVFI
jgi:hypothetical protein